MKPPLGSFSQTLCTAEAAETCPPGTNLSVPCTLQAGWVQIQPVLSPAFTRKGKHGSRQGVFSMPGLSQQRGTDCVARRTRWTESSHSNDSRGIGAQEFCHRRVKAGGAAQLRQSPLSQTPCLGELPGQQPEGSPSAGSQGRNGVGAGRRQRPLSGELQPQMPERESFPTASAARKGSGCMLGARRIRRQPKHAWSPLEKSRARALRARAGAAPEPALLGGGCAVLQPGAFLGSWECCWDHCWGAGSAAGVLGALLGSRVCCWGALLGSWDVLGQQCHWSFLLQHLSRSLVNCLLVFYLLMDP